MTNTCSLCDCLTTEAVVTCCLEQLRFSQLFCCMNAGILTLSADVNSPSPRESVIINVFGQAVECTSFEKNLFSALTSKMNMGLINNG